MEARRGFERVHSRDGLAWLLFQGWRSAGAHREQTACGLGQPGNRNEVAQTRGEMLVDTPRPVGKAVWDEISHRHPFHFEAKMNIEQELAARWIAGMKGYRKEGEPFVGNPLVELRVELLDAINYGREANRQGMLEDHHKNEVEIWLTFLLGYVSMALRQWNRREAALAGIDVPNETVNTSDNGDKP